MRSLIFLAVLLVAPNIAFAQNIESHGPWRSGVLAVQGQSAPVYLATNPVDQVKGLFTLGFRCQGGKYKTILTRRDDKQIFTKGKIYDLAYNIGPNGEKTSLQGLAFSGTSLVLAKQVPVKALPSNGDIRFHVIADGKQPFDASFPLTGEEDGLRSIRDKCAPDDA